MRLGIRLLCAAVLMTAVLAAPAYADNRTNRDRDYEQMEEMADRARDASDPGFDASVNPNQVRGLAANGAVDDGPDWGWLGLLGLVGLAGLMWRRTRT